MGRSKKSCVLTLHCSVSVLFAVSEPEQRQDATKKPIWSILFLYYEESLVSSNLNSKLFRFHCVRLNIHKYILMYKVILKKKSWGQIMVTLWPKITEMPSNSNPKLRSSSCSYAKRSSINSHDMHRMSLGLLRMHWSVIMRSRDYFWASLLSLL